MKMLFSSSTSLEVEVVKRKFLQAGISCEVRGDVGSEDTFPIPSYLELWVTNDADFQAALTLFRRLSPKPALSWPGGRGGDSGLSGWAEIGRQVALS